MVGEAEARLFVGWEEVAVSNDKGRRVVNYYVKDSDGRRDLAVVGREKSLRHMSYVVRNQFLQSVLLAGRGSSSSAAVPLAGVGFGCLKWKSRREVVDWLSEIVSDSVSPGPSLMGDGFLNDYVVPRYNTTGKGLSSGRMTQHSKEFSWLGSPWNCRKRRKHYRSFCRNKITISVHDFVYVMAEEGKRLVAYVEDLYEDMRANNMVVVRWFHKVDEVGIVLPPDVHDREIFFSLCLQDFSVECIDGLASVLSAQDFDKFQNEARHRFSSWEPYLCRRQIDNDDVKPFDITQVQGYWSQEVLRSMYTTSGTSLKVRLKITHRGPSCSVDQDGYVEPKKKKQRLNDETINATGMSKDVNKPQSLTSAGSRVPRPVSGYAAPDMLRKQLFKHKLQQQQQRLAKGCHVEVLSQDSGLRGCWFRCVVLKRHHDKVKVQYQDVQDADDTGNLEEWVLASRVASPDRLSIRLCGRTVVRPDPSQGPKFSCSLGVGSVVDAWWHDCWWEGIIIERVSEEKIRVYFPGEQLLSTFTLSDLRPSQEWLGNKWNPIKDRPEMARSLLSDMDKGKCLPSDGNIPVRASVSNQEVEADVQRESSAACKPPLLSEEHSVQRETEAVVPNLARGLDGLHWNKYKKRKHPRELGKGGSGPRCKRQFGGSTSSSSSPEAEEEYNSGGEFLMPKSLSVVDHENCKIGGDPLFAPPLALCSSLVMSQ
ncbi:uncharacterized protein M6B38_272420 [Iris pallida]|uniref:BAH domain-containing protein n=1 Tax=Iris pallida TaxID=29817 RepID=A0AAX6I6X1_IRIPA|nr:uncharacterized protein M6B38_272420 [Iris pallida]